MITNVELIEIVEFRSIQDNFWDRVSASIDVGYNISKASNLRQFNSRAFLGYLTDGWEASGSYNRLFTSQDSVANNDRMDGNILFSMFLPKDWYVFYSNNFLSNIEQKLKFRSTTMLGIGNYVARSNAIYLGLFVGAALNNERYTEVTEPDKQSGEAFAGFGLNLFNTGNLSLLTNAIGYPSLTESGRFRLDFKFDIKYDLPLDFYIKIGTTINYDN